MKPPKTHKRTAACNIYQSFSKEDPDPLLWAPFGSRVFAFHTQNVIFPTLPAHFWPSREPDGSAPWCPGKNRAQCVAFVVLLVTDLLVSAKKMTLHSSPHTHTRAVVLSFH